VHFNMHTGPCTPICTPALILLLPIALPDDAPYQHSGG
jgi:hypothetical protein